MTYKKIIKTLKIGDKVEILGDSDFDKNKPHEILGIDYNDRDITLKILTYDDGLDQDYEWVSNRKVKGKFNKIYLGGE